MRKHLILLGAVAAVAAAAFIGSAAAPLDAAQATARRHIVEIRNLEFFPRELSVEPGDTVVWINRDLVPHTVTADDATWDSEYLGAGEEWQIVVTPGMSGDYVCLYHPKMTARLHIGTN